MTTTTEPRTHGSCTCGGAWHWDKECAVSVCKRCGKHKGLARCWCGWSESGRNGADELREMGEVIQPEE
jgi:hypothetical protein